MLTPLLITMRTGPSKYTRSQQRVHRPVEPRAPREPRPRARLQLLLGPLHSASLLPSALLAGVRSSLFRDRLPLAWGRYLSATTLKIECGRSRLSNGAILKDPFFCFDPDFVLSENLLEFGSKVGG